MCVPSSCLPCRSHVEPIFSSSVCRVSLEQTIHPKSASFTNDLRPSLPALPFLCSPDTHHYDVVFQMFPSTVRMWPQYDLPFILGSKSNFHFRKSQYHGLCGSNKLMYKRCAFSTGEGKFRPHGSHMTLTLTLTPAQNRTRKTCCCKKTARYLSCSFRFEVRRQHSLQV